MGRRFAITHGLSSLALYFSGFFVFWTPLPLFYLSLKGDRKTWGLSFALLIFTALSLYYLLPVFGVAPDLQKVRFFGLGYLLYYLLIAIFLSLGVWKGWSLARLGGLGALVITVSVLVVALSLHFSGLVNVTEKISQTMAVASQGLDQILQQAASQTDRLDQRTFVIQMKKSLQALPTLLPALIFVFTLFVLSVNLAVLSLLLRAKTKETLRWTSEFGHLQLAPVWLWLLISSASLYFLDIYYLHTAFLKIVASNLLIAAGFVYFIQGLSVLSYFVRRYSFLFRVGIYGLFLLFFQHMSLGMVALGLADWWFDFRKLQQQKT